MGKGSPEDVLTESAVGLSGKIGKSAVGDVEDMNFPEFHDSDCTKSCGLVESVQTPFVPKTHADAGLFLLLKAAELCRE